MRKANKDLLSAAILFAQGILTIFWWPWISSSGAIKGWFFSNNNAEIILAKFAAPDLLAFAAGSIVAAALSVTGSAGAPFAAWFVLGAATYACIGAVAVNWPLFTVPLADALMAATVLTSLFCAVRLTRRRYG